MKNILFCLSIFTFVNGYSQSLPINFEGDITTEDFVDFDGGTAAVTANPLEAGINTSSTVGSITRNGEAVYAGSKIILSDNLDFSVITRITMKVYTSAPIGTVVKFKLEGAGAPSELDAFTTVSNEWETLEWIFLDTPENLNEIVFMFDFGNIGDGSANSTFYFDDVEQVEGPAPPEPTTLPIDFETGIENTDILSFSGAGAIIIPNPQSNGINTSNTVCQVIRDGGQFWAGSYMSLVENLDLSTNWVISMKVYTTAPVGTTIKLELQGPDAAYATDYLTTTSSEWETISWNFDGQVADFDRLVFMFDFGNVGDGSANSTFLFDDVQQIEGPAIPDPVPTALPVDFEESVVSTDFENVFGAITTVIPNPQVDATNPSATVGQFVRSGGQAWAQSKLVLTEFMDYSTLSNITMKIFTDAPVGTVLKLKVESTESGAANELDVTTTVSGAWETYSWDFAGDPPVYNVLTFMFGYGTVNNASPEATFLFDDIQQTDGTVSTNDLVSELTGVTAYPNPAKNQLTISSNGNVIQALTLIDLLGNEVTVLYPNDRRVNLNVTDLASGIYIARISTITGTGSIRVVIE
jgi:hypothetical protein